MVVDLPDQYASEQQAIRFASCLTFPLILTFSGEIGAGKTTFIRAMLRALGITSAIKSPTFSLVESYQLHEVQIHHFDLYRIDDETELEYIGFRDYFSANALCCIEWPERAKQSLDRVDISFSLRVKNAGRELIAQASSSQGIKILACLVGE